eukprot:13441599-Heterocapsa_arctica.AAC.1
MCRASPDVLLPSASAVYMAAGMLKVPRRPAIPPASAASKRSLAESSSTGILAWGACSVV